MSDSFGQFYWMLLIAMANIDLLMALDQNSDVRRIRATDIKKVITVPMTDKVISISFLIVRLSEISQ